MAKVSKSLTERNYKQSDISPLFNQKGEVIGTFHKGRITYFKNSSSSLAANSTNTVNRLTRDKSLTELLGGPL